MGRRKKQSCAGFRNGDLFCYNCGRSYHIQYPQPTSIAAAIMTQFDKDHRNCPKTWEPPIVDQSLPEREKAIWWKTGMNGERGMSSDVMWDQLYNNWKAVGDNTKTNSPHPCDPDDFRRCYLLLETVPEWKDKLHLLKALSPIWVKLVDNWAHLTQMLEEQMKTGKPAGMYEFMKELGC